MKNGNLTKSILLKESTHHVVVRNQTAHDLLTPQLSTVDVVLHLLPERGEHLLVETVDFGERQVDGEPRSPAHVLDLGPHLEPS